MSKTVFLVAGGTGGHVFPALALAEELRRRNVHVQCITDKRAEKYYHQTQMVPHVVESSAWASDWWGKAKAASKIICGMIQSFELYREYRPSCVVGFGGYPSFPTLKAGQLLGTPTILHEQNAIFGRANRQLANHAKALALSFKETKSLPGGSSEIAVYTGNPVREKFVGAPHEFRLPNDDKPFHLFIFGGSQGSSIFSTVLPQAIALMDDALRARINIIQQARHEDVDGLTTAYKKIGVKARVQPFFTDILPLYHKAHLVVSRAGASTIAELTALGIPSIIVPLAISLDGDQAQNARHLVAHKAGLMMEEKDFTSASLAAKLTELLSQPAHLAAMAQEARKLGKPAAASHLADLVMKYL